ncbi:transglutaminase family protein [Aurantimonas sp. VKM B-3413]|uniref:transglutaminase family protein n=1 Tax=Aurantimonas sp. VKM B-3413 TaxID=2779401 RepID=UPI001E458C90|nr:transglutaminase family protein [Aurantimonas sp. VKM B-3413]MCB8837970.1 transglutaminase family protein [Aurantimonas sp. VKM B-3413]
MPRLTIRHRTDYRYREPVGLGPHRLMLRPRESRDLRLEGIELAVSPTAQISWAQDVFGNMVATASFGAMSDSLTIDSLVTLDLSAEAWPVFPVSASATSYPFRYSDDERADLGALAQPQYFDPDGRLAGWANGFVVGNPTDTLSLLKDLSVGVSGQVSYQSRDEEGTQGPLTTLDRGWGSCRDFAVLFAEAARSLGIGARIVSGYLFNPDGAAIGAGSTHAWVEIYLPGAGWIMFDPTNRSVGGFNLIPVAVARDIRQIMPISGSFVGNSDAFAGMTVEVGVTNETGRLFE